jgi:lipoprotein-releasing system ATP-binding protein
MNNPRVILSCEHLSKSFHDADLSVDVLKDIQLEICQADMVAIIGDSGSGKSTLLHLLAGLEQPTTGTLLFMQQDLSQLSEKNRCLLRNKHMGFIYQFHHLMAEFSALENTAMPLMIAKWSARKAREHAIAMLEKVGLKDRLKHRIAELSGGERQRCAIARALIHHPSCVLADEPTGNLDPKTAKDVFTMMAQLQKQLEMSFVLVTHNHSLAKKADCIFQLKNGCLQQCHHLAED